jgi:DNA-binding response OmpR family regulator
VTVDTPSPLPTDDHRPTILVVDDDTEVLRFLRLILQPSYQVVTQSSAIEAIAWLSGATPDLIVSDVMMVGMDGYELCSRLKKDVTYCHLPIVLLTAKVSIEERIHGLNVGADAYVTKPFDPDYLKALIGSLLDNRIRLRHLLTSSTSVRDVRVEPLQEEGVEVNPEIKDVAETAILEQDSVFMTRLYAFMEEHISDAELDLPQLLDVVAMSRSKLYYKMQSLVGQSPNAFFRTYRLNRAAEMIREGKEKIAYIGELTGFSSSSHFAASFKKQFGVLPSEYKG